MRQCCRGQRGRRLQRWDKRLADLICSVRPVARPPRTLAKGSRAAGTTSLPAAAAHLVAGIYPDMTYAGASHLLPRLPQQLHPPLRDVIVEYHQPRGPNTTIAGDGAPLAGLQPAPPCW